MVSNKKNPDRILSPKLKKLMKKASAPRVVPSTSGSTMKSGGSETNMQVIIRVRPPNERELQENHRIIINSVDDQMLIFDPKGEDNPFFYRGVAQKGRDLLKKQNKELEFIFDRVFGTSSTNEDLFNGSTRDMIGSLLEGYNCSVFAYGATGAGKTHTMLGKEEEPGITYRTMAELFAQMEKLKEERDFNLGVTYLEIYNENVQDLLHKSGPLHLRDDGRNGVRVTGMKIITIDNAGELFDLLSKGNKNRTQFATDANGESSRSHAVFQVYISMTNKLDRQLKCMKLSMIDLAGSERGAATGCKGDRFKEGANINKSLLALGNCINSLADGTKHIPYRDSKLTRLLKDSLGGNCQTVMIANISPSSLTYEDTYNTLRYANRAKKIKTTVKKNIVSCQMHVTGYIKIIEEQKKENAEQKKENAELKAKLAELEGNGARPATRALLPEDNSSKKLVEEFVLKLQELWIKKKRLHEKVLMLESQDKILCCRMSYKREADERLRCLTAVVNPIPDEQNASGRSRLKKSFEHFERQRDSIRIQLPSIWEEVVKVEEEICQLNLQIKEKNLTNALSKDQAILRCELERSWIQQQFEHVKKISSQQQCDRHSCAIAMKDVCRTLQNYYYILCGQGNLTENMEAEFKKLVKNLKGVRNIKWLDSKLTKQEEDFYNMTMLSVEHLKDPLITEPVGITHFEIENGNVTQDTPPNANHDSTITIAKEESPVESEMDEPEPQQLNDTFSLESNKIKITKKRGLSVQNVGGSSPPAKLAKKLPAVNLRATSGKENGSAPHRTVMSAKSVAILNKLKLERMKMSNNPSAVKDGHVSKKIVQKPAAMQPRKMPPAPSSRVPW